MRRGLVVVLALAAAIAAPLRAACATTCVDTPGAGLAARHAPATPAIEMPPDAPCHEPGDSPVDEPASPCAHDHDASLKPAVRTNADAATASPAVGAPFFLATSAPAAGTNLILAPRDITRGSPPPRHLPLRI